MKRILLALALAVVIMTFLLLVDVANPVRETDGEVRIATWNLEWFNDDDALDDPSEIGGDFAAPNRAAYLDRVRSIADAIHDIDPVFIALQEVENAQVVRDLADALAARHGAGFQVAFVQGHDVHTGQDVAALVKAGYPVAARRFDFSGLRGQRGYKDLSKHLVVETRLDGEAFVFVTVHLSTQTHDRRRQARTLRFWTEHLVAATNLIVLGDLNAGGDVDQTTPESDLGIIRGFQTRTTDDDLFDAHARLVRRGTHVGGRALDRVLLSPSLVDDATWSLAGVETRRDLAILGSVDTGRGIDYTRPSDDQDRSDHYPLVVTLAARSIPRQGRQ